MLDVTRTLSGDSGARVDLCMVVEVGIPREPFESPLSNTSPAMTSSHRTPETPKEMGIVKSHEDVPTALATAKAVLLQMQSPSDVPNTIVEGASSASEAASTLVDIWTPVFRKIDTFCRLMDMVTEVFVDRAHADDKIQVTCIRFIRMPKRLGSWFPQFRRFIVHSTYRVE